MSRQCLHLTISELIAYLAAGHNLVSGPYSSRAECLAHCSSTGTGDTGTGSGTPTTCGCPAMSARYQFTISDMVNGFDGCANANCTQFNNTFHIIWDGSRWISTETGPACDDATVAPLWEMFEVAGTMVLIPRILAHTAGALHSPPYYQVPCSTITNLGQCLSAFSLNLFLDEGAPENCFSWQPSIMVTPY